jgi:hypothetical protein
MNAEKIAEFVNREVAGHTLGGLADALCMWQAVQLAAELGIPGAIVECGVWKGGMLRMAQGALADLNVEREIWAYDTFAGMTTPGEKDARAWEHDYEGLVVPLDAVRAYLGDKVRYVVGDVKETVWKEAPEQIAVLRLDVDWYDNTLACLRALYPRLSPGGALLVDDYVFWPGCRKAVNEYLGERAKDLIYAGTGKGLIK